MKNPTNIASFEEADPAGILARKLRDAGFNARVHVDLKSRAMGRETNHVWDIRQVMVPAIQAVRALSWCREFDAAEACLSNALRCPDCGSLRITTSANEELVCGACKHQWPTPVSALVGNH